MKTKVLLLLIITFLGFGISNAQTGVELSDMVKLATPSDSSMFVAAYDSAGVWVPRKMYWIDILKAMADGASIEVSGSVFRIKPASVDKTKINSDVAGTGLTQDTDGSIKIADEGIITGMLEDSLITKPKCSTSLLQYIGSGGTVTNNPDDKTIVSDGSVISVKKAATDTMGMSDNVPFVLGSDRDFKAKYNSSTGDVDFTGAEINFNNNYIKGMQNISDLAAGIIGNYYSFDGVDDYGEIANCAEIADDVDRTIVFNFKAPSGQIDEYPRILEKNGQYYCFASDYGNNTGTTYFSIYDGSNGENFSIDNSYLFDDIWHNIAWVIDRTNQTMKLYIDGVLKGTNSDISGIGDIENVNSLVLGAVSASPIHHINMSMSKFQQYTVALTASEIKALYSGAPVPYKHVGASQTELITGTDSDMSGANNWVQGVGALTFDINTTIAGKMFCDFSSGSQNVRLNNVFTSGKTYRISLKARLNSGTATTIQCGSVFNSTIDSKMFTFVPTGTETTFTGTVSVEPNSYLNIGILNADNNGSNYEFDDISVTQVGNVLNLGKSKTSSSWYDESGNDLDATMYGPVLHGYSNTIGTKRIQAVDTTGLGLYNKSGDGIKIDNDGNIIIGGDIIQPTKILASNPASTDTVFSVAKNISGTETNMMNVTGDGISRFPNGIEVGERIIAPVMSDFFIQDDYFPCKQVLYRNEEMNNNLSTADGTEITVSAIYTSGDSITLSWLPYVSTICSPMSGKEWALMDLENISPADPAVSGDYSDILKITSGNYSTRTLHYNIAQGSDANWSVGDKIALYNPYISNLVWNTNNPIISNSSGWRATYVAPLGGFHHSDGSYVLLVMGMDAYGVKTTGAFKSDGRDWTTWTVLNSDNAIFTSGGSGWRADGFVGGPVLKLPNEDRYIMYGFGYNSTDTRYRIGWVKFDEDFTSGSIEYSDNEILTSSGNGFAHPTVIQYGARWRMAVSCRDDNPSPISSSNPWSIIESYSSIPEGPFTASDTILVGRTTNDGIYNSSHSDIPSYFSWKGRLYMFVGATSRYKYSGTRANREFGLYYWNDRESTPSWVADPRNPILINPMYSDNVWPGVDDWAKDHIGAHPVIAFNKDDGKMYIFFSANTTTDTYKIGIVTMDIQTLLERY